MEKLFYIFKIQTGIEHIPQFILEFIRLLPHTAVQVDKISVEIIEYLEIAAGRLMEQNPARATEHFDISSVFQREPSKDFIPQCFLASHPRHKAVDDITSLGEVSRVTETRRKKEPFSMYGFPYTQNDLFFNLGYSIFQNSS